MSALFPGALPQHQSYIWLFLDLLHLSQTYKPYAYLVSDLIRGQQIFSGPGILACALAFHA